MIETMLISSIVSPSCIGIQKKRSAKGVQWLLEVGGINSNNGHVMNFIQHVEQVATRLPHSLSSINSILLLNRETPYCLIQFKVRKNYVLDALSWLKENNQYYSDIIIDRAVLNSLSDDDDVIDLLPNVGARDNPAERDDQNLDNHIESSCIPNLPNVDVQRVIP